MTLAVVLEIVMDDDIAICMGSICTQVLNLAWVQKHVWSGAVSLEVPREGVVRGMQVR